MSEKVNYEGLYHQLKNGDWKPMKNIKTELDGEFIKYIGTKEELEELMMRVFILREEDKLLS